MLAVLRRTVPWLLVAASCGPLVIVAGSAAAADSAGSLSTIATTLSFALGGAGLATALGTLEGLVVGTVAFRGRKVWTAILMLPLLAPPALWWLGIRRLPGLSLQGLSGLAGATLIAGFALAPIPFALVLAATRECPRNVYSAARLALAPAARILRVLLPLVSSAALSGFLIGAILLCGESELPFLLGFRTSMTDAITAFARSFEPGAAAAAAAPLAAVVLVLAGVAARPVLRAVLPSARSSDVGIARAPGRWGLAVALVATLPFAASVAGFAATVLRSPEALRSPAEGALATVARSLAEPVLAAWLALAAGAMAAYLVRRSPVALRVLLVAGLVVACMPPAISAIGWLALGQRLGTPVPPLFAHALHSWGLGAIAFAVAYARLPPSLEQAAELLPIPPAVRAFRLLLPSVTPSLVAAAVLAAALVYADRDVASLMLPPGSERLMLDLYLRAANAPAAVVSGLALAVLGCALAVGMLAALGPWLLLRPRG